MEKGVSLLEDLEKLRLLLCDSGVERTITLGKEMGFDCPYHRKSRDLFIQNDYEKIMKQFLVVLDKYRIVEGSHFGEKKE